jgi:hypothetical protein
VKAVPFECSNRKLLMVRIDCAKASARALPTMPMHKLATAADMIRVFRTSFMKDLLWGWMRDGWAATRRRDSY